MGKDSFILYLEQQEIFEMLTDEQAGQLIKNIFAYERTGDMPQMDKMLNLAFIPIMQALDKNRYKYEEKCKKNKENIEKRWNKKNTSVYERKKTNTNYTDNDNEYDNEHVNDNDIDKKEKNKKRKTFDDVFSENHFSKELENTIKDFIDMRKIIKKPMTTKALELLIRNLEKLTNLEEEKIAILNQSIEHGWQTVYPLKQYNNNTSKSGMNDFKELWEEAKQQDDQTRNNTSDNSFSW